MNRSNFGSALVNLSSIGDLPITRTDLNELASQFTSQILAIKANHLDSLANLLKKNLAQVCCDVASVEDRF